MSQFSYLGRALRWLRERKDWKQFQVADVAGITRTMLSAYETGKVLPSLGTLDKILISLDANLNDLQLALKIARAEESAGKGGPGAARAGPPEAEADGDRDAPPEQGEADFEAAVDLAVRAMVAIKDLGLEEQEALRQMLRAMHGWIHSLRKGFARARGTPPAEKSTETG